MGNAECGMRSGVGEGTMKFATANPSVGGEELKAADAAMFDVRGFRLRVGYGATSEV
jgi:hypothetical protein